MRLLSPVGTKRAALTNVDGYFKLKLPPGVYDLRVHYELYRPQRIAQVTIAEREAQRLDVRLETESKVAVQEVVIAVKQDRRQATVLLDERKRAVATKDALSAQEISRSADSGANEAVKRMPSTTLRDGRYVIVRGLGGRYSQTLLNGSILPSPEPDEPAIPLDLFPTALLANLSVIKSYDLPLPGSFTGGALLIETNSYPTRFEAKLQLKLEYNSEATFRSMPSYAGGAGDPFGYDDGTRRLPRSVPSNAPVVDPFVAAPDRARIGADFNPTWQTHRRLGLPNLSLNASVGGTRHFGAGRRLGYLVGLTWGHRDEVRQGVYGKGEDVDGAVAARDFGTQVVGREIGQLGLLGNVGLSLGKQDVNLFVVYAHSGEKEAIEQVGYAQADNTDYTATRLRLIQRDLVFTQLRGQHPLVHALQLDWQLNVGYTLRREPDTRDVYRLRVDDALVFRTQAGNGERLFSTLRELTAGGGLDLLVPWKRLRVRVGGSVQVWSRRFEARRFRSFLRDPSLATQDPNQLLAPERYGTSLDFEEVSLRSDSYMASQLIGGGYVSAELLLPAQLRLLGGVRYEGATQELTPGVGIQVDPGPATAQELVRRREQAPIPSLNLIWGLHERMNLRASYAYTVTRPRLRELAQFQYFDFERRRSVSGRADLETTTIHNADLRWEWFLRSGGVLAASLFYKRFDRPIEQVIVSAQDQGVSWANGSAADLVGGELELRCDFGVVHPRLRPLYVSANLSLIWSRTTVSPERRGNSTSGERPLQGQSPYVVNLTLGYSSERRGTDVTLLYNVFGDRLSDVGFNTLPDVYELPQHRVDLAVSQRLHREVRLKVAATNLAYQPIRFVQGGVVFQSYQPGVSALALVEWSR